MSAGLDVYSNVEYNALRQAIWAIIHHGSGGGKVAVDNVTTINQMGLVYVKEKNLKPVTTAITVNPATKEINTMGVNEVISENRLPSNPNMQIMPQFLCGGIRSPHIHAGNNLYLLTPQQWTEYSQGVVKALTSKLMSAKTVTPGQLNSIAEQVDTLG